MKNLRFKFRVWYEGKIYEVHELNITGNTVAIISPSFPFIQDILHYSLMQYTGLKDRNGEEIWEGDILQDARNPEDISVVKWDEGLAGFMVPLKSYCERWYEVIGNVYENSELFNTE